MTIKNSKIIILLFLIIGFSIPIFKIFAQNVENLEEICQLEKIEEQCNKISATDCRQLLEKCESYFEQKSQQIDKDITKTESQKKTLKNQISILSNKIKQLDYQISQNNLMIKDLTFQVNDTSSSIDKTNLKIEDSKKQLSSILREIYEQDQSSLIEILLKEKEISGFFDNIVALESLDSKNRELLENIKNLKTELENQKKSLDDEKDGLENVVKIQALQKEESASNKKDQEYYLKLTETQYQQQLKAKEEVQKNVAEIKSRIFELIGVPKAPTFGEALDLAYYVEKVTGIRPAFLLAILTQESDIGKNVGQCYLSNVNTGAGVYFKNGQTISRVMRPKSDIPYFIDICNNLGRDYLKTLVSCPMSFGWGGAMGPGQFIPSTWVLQKDDIRAITGKSPDPWDIKDAFLATGIYLKKLGGIKDEWTAAMKYFSGSSWTKSEQFYGNSVIALAKKYQSDINLLTQQ